MKAEERDDLKTKVMYSIINDLLQNSDRITDLGDIGNYIGIAISKITCKNGKDLNLWSFEKDDFILGFNHGYSLNNGTH
jgi:hypothetical protein